MASRKIMRCQGARGQLALYNPHSVPAEVAQELAGIYGFQPKEAVGCLADVMISQQKGKYPPVAFMLVCKDAPEYSIESTIDRKERPVTGGKLQRAEKAFEHVYAIAVLPIPRFAELQLLAISKSMQMKIFPVFSLPSAVKLMVSVHEKLDFGISKKADELNKRIKDELLTRKHAMDTLSTNFPFLSLDECEMLLDLFGSIASIAQAGVEKLLEETVLSSSSAHAIEEFFNSEYVVE